MILDSKNNLNLYKGLCVNLNLAIDFLMMSDFDFKGKSKIEIDGNNVFALNINYQTKEIDDFVLEAHKKYVDLHYIIKGQESIIYELNDNNSIIKNYCVEDDYLLFKPVIPVKLLLKEGMFCILFKDDLHMPGFINERKMDVQKLVLKVIMEKI